MPKLKGYSGVDALDAAVEVSALGRYKTIISPVLIAILLLLMVADFVCFLLSWGESLRFIYYACLHFGISLIAWGIYYVAYRLSFDFKFHTLNATLITFLGPFSLVIAVLTLGFYFIFKKFSPPLSQLLQELNPDVERSKGEVCYQAIMTAGAARPGSQNAAPLNYYDIVELGTTKQKQQAIGKILRHFQPRFAPILFALINDEVSCIRVLAATAINTIDQTYTEMLINQEKVVEKSPGNTMELKTLARISETYLELNILDEDRKVKLEEQVASLFERLFEKLPDDPEVIFSYSKCLEFSDKKEIAFEVLYQAFQKGVELTPPMKLSLIQLAFHNLPHDQWLSLLSSIHEGMEDKELHLQAIEEIELEEIINLWQVNGRLSQT